MRDIYIYIYRERERERKKRVKTVRETLVCDTSSDVHKVEVYLQRALLLRAFLTNWYKAALQHRAACLPWDNAQNGMTANCLLLILLTADLLLSTRGWKLPSLCIFRMLMYASDGIPVVFPLSFVYLNTQVHILFWNPQIYCLVKSQYVSHTHTRTLYIYIYIYIYSFVIIVIITRVNKQCHYARVSQS